MTSARFNALGCGIRVDADDPVAHEAIGTLFRHFEPAMGDERVYRLTGSAATGLSLEAGGQTLTATMQTLVRDVDEHVIAHSDHVLVHAGVVAMGSHGLALVGRSGSGKSTLVAGLVRDGFDYLSDEFLALDVRTGEVLPYPRFITLHETSWSAFPDLAPAWPPELDSFTHDHWQIDPDAIGAGTVAASCAIRTIVFVDHRPGSDTRLERVSGASALVELVNTTFHFHRHGVEGFGHLGAIASRSSCYGLSYGDLAAAVGQLREMFDEVTRGCR